MLLLGIYIYIYIYNLTCPDRLTHQFTAKTTVIIHLKFRGNVIIIINK